MLTAPRRIALSLVAFLLLGALALFSAWFFVDPTDYRATINRHATEAFGQPVETLGNIALTFSPLPTVTVDGIRIGNPDGFEAASFAELASVHATITPLDLLQGKLAFTTIEAADVTVELERNPDGGSNWREVVDALGEAEDEGAPPLEFTGIQSVYIEAMTLNRDDRQRGSHQRLVLRELSVDQLNRGGAGTLGASWHADGSDLGEAKGTLSGRFELSESLALDVVELMDLQAALTLPMAQAGSLPLEITALVELDPGGETADLSRLTVSGDGLSAEIDGQLLYDDNDSGRSTTAILAGCH